MQRGHNVLDPSFSHTFSIAIVCWVFVGNHTAGSCIFSELMHVLGIKSLLNLGLKGCSDTFLTMIMNFQMLQLLIDYVYLFTTDILL